MLDNNKCILVYGLSNDRVRVLKELGYKIIEITPEMCEMTLMDVLLRYKIKIFNSDPIKEKVILYNNLSEDEIRKAISGY